MALWDNLDETTFDVVRNARGQYSIWPAGRPHPPGWAAAGFSGTRPSCLAEIDRIWAPGPPAAGVAARPGELPDGAALAGPSRELPDTSIMALIRARELPEGRLAVRYGAERLTRGELLDTSALWARALADAGCGREVPVAILLPRGPEALVAILAVLEAGGAYVALACDQPVERIRAVLDDCGAHIAVATEELAPELAGPGRTLLTVAELAERGAASTTVPRPASGEDLAFVFYTSGTTGEPKGVEGTHAQLVNYALWCGRAFAHRREESTFLSGALYFLGSLTTIFTPLLEGWPITVAPDGATTDELLAVAASTEGGLLKLTPTHIRMMMARGVPETGLARQLMIGSEPLVFTEEISQWLAADPERVLVNHYGLTETHGCFCHWLGGDERIGGRVPIGTPIDNVEAYVVGRDGELLGVDEIGELLVGGPSLGRGYRNRPALTAERWLPHPWGAEGARLLRTGDLARVDADGVVTVLGRADRQVKVRGHRVEPAAVEEALRSLPNVKEALVLPRQEEGRTTLAAYLLHAPGAGIDLVATRTALERLFPPQWIPGRMAAATEFPVNANGKVDTRALPEALPIVPPTPAGPGAGRWSRLDRLVADAFCDILRIDSIGLGDGFHDLGGDSLTAVQVAARIGRELGRDVPAPSADATTVRAYAELVAAGAAPGQAR
ncbi:amino acid adenylation domain-containing protein [Kitasatospora sp. NBC_01287]|uniref:amino acid adenylation domain-containing protein n=1 Tax=Kitasatospora sp. NBC_01287 TaxID=2903573 RepID=UPI00224D226D|nr:amino acid adenylation domain-containing protein [Kitasatospora sp. NBC_01287]MCX4745051.1 amino acid adenylation domain-containing protein [Kitasatospora sp. NBC_01287]